MKTKIKFGMIVILSGLFSQAQTIKVTATGTIPASTIYGNTSVVVGNGAGAGATTTGTNNCFFGFESGKVNTSGGNNTFAGYKSGAANASGSYNSFFGSEAGLMNTASGNTFFGYQSGRVNVSGSQNSYFGRESGVTSTGGSNTFMGFRAGYLNSSGGGNTCIGSAAGYNITTGGGNVLIGSGASMIGASSGNVCIGGTSGAGGTGENNIFLGSAAGYGVTGNNNILMGTWTGNGQTISNKLIIDYDDNGDFSDVLIEGDFADRYFKVNGKTGIGMGTAAFPTNALYTSYNLFVTGGILADEVRVKLSSSGTWPDYVFLDDYKLPSLDEVESYIKTNGRLMNVPSATQVGEDGIEMGQMAIIQQEKIEELTLYLIEQNNALKKQSEEIAELKAMVEALANKR